MPCAMAPAWPLVPPPITLTLMSNLRWVPVTRSGASAAISSTRRPRYASGSFSLTGTGPSPGCRRTRAIAFFRRPVPRFIVSANLHVSFRIECDDFRLLRNVTMVGPGVDAKALQHIGSQCVALQHAAHGGPHRERGVQLLGALERALAEGAGVARVPRVFLRLHLGAGDLHLGGIDHHDVVAAVQVRRERRLVLAAQARAHALPPPAPP